MRARVQKYTFFFKYKIQKAHLFVDQQPHNSIRARSARKNDPSRGIREFKIITQTVRLKETNSQSSAAPAVSESLKLEPQAENPQLQAPKIPAQAGWPESPVSAPSNPNWAPQSGAPQNPASSQPAGPNWDVHVDQSKAWDSEEKSNAQQPAAPTSQSAWPKTSASSGTDAWNPPRPNSTTFPGAGAEQFI